MDDRFFGGLVIIIFLIAALIIGFIWGEVNMEHNCVHYGKHVDGQEVYICEKQK